MPARIVSRVSGRHVCERSRASEARPLLVPSVLMPTHAEGLALGWLVVAGGLFLFIGALIQTYADMRQYRHIADKDDLKQLAEAFPKMVHNFPFGFINGLTMLSALRTVVTIHSKVVTGGDEEGALVGEGCFHVCSGGLSSFSVRWSCLAAGCVQLGLSW